MKAERILTFSTLLILVAGGLCFLIELFSLNRFAADDWFFIGKLREQSPPALTLDWYFEYGGRWFSYFSESLVLTQSQDLANGIGFIQVLLFHISIGIFIYSFLKKHTFSTRWKDAFRFCTVLSICIWICLPEPGEFFTWLSSSVIYLNGCTLLFLLSAALNLRWPIIVQVILILFFTGTSELLVFFYLAVLAFLYFRNGTNRKTMLLLFSVCFFQEQISIL